MYLNLVPEFCGVDGEDVAALDFGVAAVAFDELECDLMFVQQRKRPGKPVLPGSIVLRPV